jgi:hypothetical protein
MVREPFNLVIQTVGMQRFQNLDKACVQRPSPFLKQTPVGHLVRQGMLEGVDLFGKEAPSGKPLRRKF